jgi:hypothetical protein
MPPTERSLTKDPDSHGMDSRPPYADRPGSSASGHWLDDFMLREGITRDPLPIPGDRQRLGRPHDEKRDAAYEPIDDDAAVKSRHFPAVVGVAGLLVVLGLGAAADSWLSNSSGGASFQAAGIAHGQPTRRTEPVAARRPPPEPIRSPTPLGGLGGQAKRRTESARPSSKNPSVPQNRSIDFALLRGAPSPLRGDTAAGFPGYPQQAFGWPPSARNDGVAALMLPVVMSSVTRARLVAKTTSRSSEWPMTVAPPPTASVRRPAEPPGLEPAAVAPAPRTESGPKLVVPKLPARQTSVASSGSVAEQRNPPPARPPATPPVGGQVTVGTPLHLQIVYAAWGPQAARAVAALQAKLKNHLRDIATSGASEWPVRHEVVIYFFPEDRAAASLVAASLAQITKRTAPMMLLRTKSAPQRGTVDILLPLRSGEDLLNDKL